ncbi:MAG: cell division protein ZapA [Paludibacteraceae bacterium]|nr:cell division protein ZapA [Paludibacteraceae bacterium]
MDDKQSISLQLDARKIRLQVSRDKEAYYREAAIMLNERYRDFQKRMPKASVEELWMYVALQIAVNLHADAHSKALKPIEKKISELDQQIFEILNQKS